jgi:inhibitor of KinA
VVSAYVSVAIFFDSNQITPADAEREIRTLFWPAEVPQGKLHVVPCCYERELDMSRVSAATGLSPAEVISAHATVEYTVYAIGFCPGFPYLGYLRPELAGVPRLAQPRMRVPPGSVGIAGRQTGIYPLPTPGGWNLIGRTPLVLVDVMDGYFPIQAGDRVQFQPIDEAEFHRLEGQRL